MRAAARLAAVALIACAAAARADAVPAWAASAPTAAVLVDEADGRVEPMTVTWFLPDGPGPFPVVVFSHGRDPSAAGRARLAVGVSHAQLLFWLARGVAVVSPVRPGYGAGAGEDFEDPGVHVDRVGHCVGRPDFGKVAEAAARSVDATLQWLARQPWADAGHVLLVGRSVGGLATVAAGAHALPGVVGTIDFADGGPARSPGRSCAPEQLGRLYADHDQATGVPGLWLPARDDDGRRRSRHMPPPWAPAVDAFLARIGAPFKAATAPRLDAGDDIR